MISLRGETPEMVVTIRKVTTYEKGNELSQRVTLVRGNSWARRGYIRKKFICKLVV
jgi:hypothetical protein